MIKTVCFGEIMLRLSPPGFERLFQSPVLNATFGGGEANVAVSLAQFGHESHYVTRLPKNPIGDAAIKVLRAEGVNVEHVQRGGERVGIYFAETGASQRASTVVYDRADKVLEIDRHSIMAIAGVPATAWEMARVLEHSLQYFRRTQLQEMSVDGKVRALSKLLRDNFGFVVQGIGVVVPIFATYDFAGDGQARLYFYDAMGAQFEVTEYAATGSGSPAVRGVLFYENKWGTRPLHKLREEDAVTVALRALDTAAEADTATGGVDRNARIFPLIKIISRDGIKTLPEKQIAARFKSTVA